MNFQSLILLFIFKCGLAIEAIKTVQKFVVEKDKSVDSSVKTLDKFLSKSVTSCSAQCSKNPNCCSANYMYDQEHTSCSLYNCCFPKIVNGTGRTYLRKYPNADIDTIAPRDCSEVPLGSDNGIYTINPTDDLNVDVFCDMRLECGTAWTIVQRRIDGTTYFYLNWQAYKVGFGNTSKEYWLGNDNLNIITNSKNYTLRFDMEDANGFTAYAEYTLFRVEDESTQYRLTIGGYSGTAGDSITELQIINGMKFTTLDHDNDYSSYNCASDSMEGRKGGWWYRSCAAANANGFYKLPGTFSKDTIYWRTFRKYVALKSISMKIKPKVMSST